MLYLLLLDAPFHQQRPVNDDEFMPGWLNTCSHLNPLAYIVDANGTLMLAGSTSTFGPSYDYAVILLTSTIWS
jgi:hypothetical protein